MSIDPYFNWELYQQESKKIFPNDSLWKKLKVFRLIPSTNKKLWELIDRGMTPPLLAIALQQTSGKGQWNRIWESPNGGLYLSFGISLDLPLDNSFHLTMSTAWGVANMLRKYNIPLLLKWPNDLILEGKKLGGIKIETRTVGTRIKLAVIGIGINWINPVPLGGINLQSYCDRNNSLNSLEQLTAVSLKGLRSGYYLYCQQGVIPILNNYQSILNSIGKTVTINGNKGTVIGVASNGKLKIKLQSLGSTSQVLLSPGEISLGYD